MITIIMDIAFTVFAIYGVYVLKQWKRAAQKLSKVCDEMHEELRPTEKVSDEVKIDA